MSRKVILMAVMLGTAVVLASPDGYSQTPKQKQAEARAKLVERKTQIEAKRKTLMDERARLQTDRQNIKASKGNLANAAAVAAREQQASRTWKCNAYGNEHDDPRDCSDPSQGGTWITKPNPNLDRALDRRDELKDRLDEMSRLNAAEEKKYNAAIAQLDGEIAQLKTDMTKAGLTPPLLLTKSDAASVNTYTTALSERLWTKKTNEAVQNLTKDKELIDELTKVAKTSKYFSADDYKVIVAIESQGDRNVGTNASGYKGLFQMGKSASSDVKADYATLGDPAKWKENVDAGTKYLEQNARTIAAAGIPVKPLNLYLAHQQGATGTARLLEMVNNGTARTTAANTNMLNNLPASYKKQMAEVGGVITVQNYYDYMSNSVKTVESKVR